MRSALLGLLVVGLFSGCHGRFKRAAPDLDRVRVQVLSEQRPTVSVSPGTDEIGAIVSVIQGVALADVEDKLLRAVDIDKVNGAFELGLDEALAGGPPFEITDRSKAPLLQVEVVEYGMEVPQLGVQGRFNYDLKVRLYDRDGRRIYATRVGCDIPVGDPKGVSKALGTVNNAKQVDEMRRKELQAAFEEAALMCGNDLAAKMRKHASPGLGADIRAAVSDVDRGW